MEEGRSNIIKAITTPLGFFALSLLIVEGFLGITLGFAKVDNQWFYFSGMIIGALLFIIVVVMVFYLTLTKPEELVSGAENYNPRTASFEGALDSTAQDPDQEKYEF
jgi:hypothetical protein